MSKSRLTGTSIAAAMVVAGVIMKNTCEQMGQPFVIGKQAGMALAAVGWLLLASVLATDRRLFSRLAVYLAALAVLYAVAVACMAKGEGRPVSEFIVYLFIGAWVVLGLILSSHFKGIYRFSGLLAASLLIGSISTLEWQRDLCLVEGPALPMFVVAFFVIILANSARSQMK